MIWHRNQSRGPKLSPPLSLKRAITTTSATDSSTASSIDDAGPGSCGKPQRKSRQWDNLSRDYLGGNCSCTESPNRKTAKRNRARRSAPLCVTFGTVRVRAYERSIGDWWDVQYGLCLGWEYVDMPAVPLPDDDESRNKASKLRKAVGKAKAKIIGWMLVSRKKRSSMGVISADSVVDVEHKTSRARIRTKRRERRGETQKTNRKLSFEDCKSTAKCREELLKDFGFSSIELDQSEVERKLLRFEYSSWTRMSQKPSKLFLNRCLKDI